VLLASLAAAPAVSASGVSGPAPASTGVDPGATSGYPEGVDVSHWQGTISWSKVAAAGKHFAMIKASESIDYVDPLYAANRSGAQAAGLWTGAYHFARPNAGAADAIAEADHFANTVHLGGSDLIPALDIEVTGGLTPSALTSWVTAWLGEASARFGVKPMIYTSPAFWKNALADTRSLADAGYKVLWVAHWGVSQPTIPAQNWGGHGWTFWQYDNCGSVPGIAGCVDLDRYNGTDLGAQAYSTFLLAAHSTGDVKQGQAGGATVGIIRTNFDSAVSLAVAGLPAGATATFDTSPTTGDAASLMVATQQSVTPTGSYRLTITGVGGGQTSAAHVFLVIVDGQPPSVVAPYTRLATRWALGSTIPAVVGWHASDPSGVASSNLQRSVNGSSWQTVALPSASPSSILEWLPIAGAATQRDRATDTLGNVSGWSSGPMVRTAVVQQWAGAIHYQGIWHTVSLTSASAHSLRYATATGASAAYAFTGSSIGWVAVRGPNRGSARVYVDGVDAGVVNLTTATVRSRAIVFARNWTSSGSHTLKIVVLGTAHHPRVDLDAFVLLRSS
jgi:GH25 family lysozyme M1 (1,4-beta-N-acetylmuramidase)